MSMEVIHTALELAATVFFALAFWRARHNGKLASSILASLALLNFGHAVLGLGVFEVVESFIPATWFIVAMLQGWYYFEITYYRNAFPVLLIVAMALFAMAPFAEISYYKIYPAVGIGRLWEMVPFLVVFFLPLACRINQYRASPVCNFSVDGSGYHDF